MPAPSPGTVPASERDDAASGLVSGPAPDAALRALVLPEAPGAGMGIDLVHIPGFAAQLQRPGSRWGTVFSAAEWRAARRRAAATGQDVAHHLAARWAGKEAFIKAWSGTLVGTAPPLAEDALDWAEIEVLSDAFGRPYLRLLASVAQACAAQGITPASCALSLTHDGDYAMAACRVVISPAGA